MLKNCPDIINIYILQRALGVRPIIFRHRNEEYYNIEIGDDYDNSRHKMDRDLMFDMRFCGEASVNSIDTLRGSVSLPIMKNLGFDDFSGYAATFDPYNFFKDTMYSKAYKAYNGIHIPSNRYEKERNLKTFINKAGNE
jgi:hypothetical protein